MKKIDLDSIQSLELSGEAGYGLICGSGCSGIVCWRDDGKFKWFL